MFSSSTHMTTRKTTNSWLHNQGSCDRSPSNEAQADPRGHPRVFTKSFMTEDIVQLLDALGIRTGVYLVGHDIGGDGRLGHRRARAPPVTALLAVTWGRVPAPGMFGS